MHSPFRGLRRAAASPGSPISCCSQTCNASGSAQISIPPFPRTHCTVMVIAGTRPPTVPPSSAGSCISPSSIWTPSSTAGGITTPRQINFPFDEQQNNENEQLILHFPHLPPSSNVLASKDNEAEQPILISLEQQSLISQYGFQTHRPRPPLNRAIPPIPESRSNESIQSSQSMLVRRPSNGLQLQTVQIIDENNPIDEPVPKQPMTADDVMGVSTASTVVETTTKTSRLPKFVRRKEKKDSEQEEKKQQKPPKSPLMSVAHSVKNKLSRLTGTKGGNAMSSSAGGEFPMSRSLEIGSKTRIPHRQINDEIPKSKSMEEQRGRNDNSGGLFLVPRRSPTTTLVLCSPGGGPRRLPPDEFLEQQKEVQILSNKQVQFVDEEEDNLPKLSPQKEFAFCVWTPEKENNLIEKINEEIKEKEDEKESKIENQNEVEKIIGEQEKKDIDVFTPVLKTNVELEKSKSSTSFSPQQPSIIKEPSLIIQKLPSPEQSQPISSVGESTITTITTTRRSRSPPRVLLTSLRKSPQSFPPLGNSSLDSQQFTEKNARQTKSTVSVSFGEVDVKKYNEKKEEMKGELKQKGEEKAGKRKVFSTRSLRMVANRVCEASPLLHRRGHSANAPQDRQKETGMGSATRFGNNKNNFDNGNQQKSKTPKSTFSTSNIIRSVNSVRTIHRPYGAPLAESESSIVANSPAVEQFPGIFPSQNGKGENKNNKINLTKRGGIFGTNSRFGRKEDKKLINEQDKNKQQIIQTKQQQKNFINNGSGGKATNLDKNVTETKTTTLNSTSIKSKSSTSFQRPTLVARLSHKKSSSQAVGTGGGGIKKGDDSNKKGSKEAQDHNEGIKEQQAMILSTTTPLGADFRLIDEPASSVHSHPTPIKTTLDNIQNGRKTSSPSTSIQSSMFLIAEQQPSTGEVSLKMLEQKMNATNLGNSSTARSRKRLSSDSKLNDNNVASIKTKAFPSSTTELTDIKSPREEQMPLADDLTKSEDGISFTPSIAAASALVVDFRSDLYKLRDSVKKDLEELEILRKQNASLQEQLAERNKIILQLQRQLRGDL